MSSVVVGGILEVPKTADMISSCCFYTLKRTYKKNVVGDFSWKDLLCPLCHNYFLIKNFYKWFWYSIPTMLILAMLSNRYICVFYFQLFCFYLFRGWVLSFVFNDLKWDVFERKIVNLFVFFYVEYLGFSITMIRFRMSTTLCLVPEKIEE